MTDASRAATPSSSTAKSSTFKELREKLAKRGVLFHSKTDTEVILNLYITEGRSFLKKLNGFFGLAIYDKEENSLFIARDRYGVKPLLVYRDEDQLFFASEMKSMLALGHARESSISWPSASICSSTTFPGPASYFSRA